MVKAYNTSSAILLGLLVRRFRPTSDLPLRTIKFCSVLFSSSWSSICCLVSLMRGGVCGTLHGQTSKLLIALQQSWIRESSKIAICAYPTCIRGPIMGTPSEYCHDVWCGINTLCLKNRTATVNMT